MHNKYATFVLPVLAGLAIVGAGFSTWVFGGNGSAASDFLTGNITVAPADDTFNVTVELGTVAGEADFTKVEDGEGFTLLLDQGGVSEASNKAVGISLTSGLASYDIKWSAAKSNFATDYNGYSLTLAYNVSVNYGDVAGTYIVWVGEATGSTTISLDQLTTTDSETYSYLWDVNIENTWNYVSKPQDFAEYSSMVSALNGNDKVTLTVTVTAELTK